jgi:hypothetical protein
MTKNNMPDPLLRNTYSFTSPDEKKVCVINCYPECYGDRVIIYNADDLNTELYFGNADDYWKDFSIKGWQNNESLFLIGEQTEYRKSDGKLKRFLSEEEDDALDFDFGEKMKLQDKRLEEKGITWATRKEEDKQWFRDILSVGFIHLTAEMKIDTINQAEGETDCWNNITIHGIDENGCLINKE